MSFTPQTVVLPVRKNALSYTPEQVEAVYNLLVAAVPGQGIQIDEAQDSLTKSATRTQRMKAQLLAEKGLEVKAHNIERDGTHIPAVSKKKAKKNAQANGNGATAETQSTPPDEEIPGQTQVTDPDQQEGDTPPENPQENPQETPQEDTTGSGDEDKPRRRRNRN